MAARVVGGLTMATTHPMQDGTTGIPAGGIPAYVKRLRKDHGMVWREPGGWWCKCGEPGCGKHFLLQHIEDWRASYEAKVQDFAAETERAYRLHHALQTARDFIAHHPAVRGEWPLLMEVIDKALARED